MARVEAGTAVSGDQLIKRRVVRLRRTWESALCTHSDRIRYTPIAVRERVIRRADYDDLRVLITALKLGVGRRSRMHHREMKYFARNGENFTSENVTHRIRYVELRVHCDLQ